MNKFKKGIMLLALLIVLIGLMVACSNGDNSGNGNSSNNTVTNANNGEEASNEDGEEIHLKYYNWDNDFTAQTTAKYIEQFEAENPNIKVESIPLVPGDSVASIENLDILLAAGEQIDVIAFPSIANIHERAAMGALQPLNEFYEDEGIDPTEEYYVNPKVGDDFYGMQYNATTNFVLLNKDALDEAGLEVPKVGWTWDDFADYAEKLTVEKDGKKQYGSYFHSWSLYMNPPAQTLLRHPFLFEDETTNFTHESFERMFEMRKELENNGYAKTYTDVLGANLGYQTEFFNEEAAMLLTGSWMIGEAADVETNPHDFVTAFAPVPVLNEGDATEYYMGGNFFSIAKSSENKEAAYKFARFISTNLSDARVEIPGYKKGDLEPLLEDLVGDNTELIDMDSLKHTFLADEIDYLEASDVSVDYTGQLDEILADGFSKYMLNDESIDEVLDWMIEKAENVIAENTN